VGARRRLLFALATSEALDRAVARRPAVRARAWRSARRYVAGETAEAALATADALARRGLASSLDLFGERVTDARVAGQVADAYVALAGRLDAAAPDVWLSLDLSHLAFSPDLLERVAAAVPPGRRLQIGAEEAAVAGRVLDLVLGAAGHGLPVEATLQANLRRSDDDAGRLAEAGVPVRLVKGAYVEDRATARRWGSETDRAYARLARQLAGAGVDVALATHDAALREELLADLPAARCELLLGVRAGDADAVARAGHRVRIYVPFGRDWFRYLMRRRAEAQGAR
jgi:proline dehydrogenase